MGSEATPRKFKLHKKIFGVAANTVDPASVPRKLRSAIKKRSCDPNSVPFSCTKRLNGVESLRTGCLKKSKLSTNSFFDRPSKGDASMVISKDEEEVAETLSALACLIPSNMDCKSFETMTSDPVEKNKALVSALKDSVALKEEPNVDCDPSSYRETSATPIPDESLKESVQERSLTDLGCLSWPKLSERRQLNLNLQVSVPQVHLTFPPLLRNCGSYEIKQDKALLSNDEPLIRVGAIDVVSCQERKHRNLIEKSLTSRTLHGSGSGLRYSMEKSSVLFPSWLTTSISEPTFGRDEDIESANKVYCLENGSGKSRKKSATHVYISHRIQEFQMSEKKEVMPSNAIHLRPSHCVSSGLDPPEDSKSSKIETNGMLSSGYMYNSMSCKNANEAARSTPVDHKLHQAQEGPSISRCCVPKKQNFDFLSLSAGMVSPADGGANKTGNNFEQGGKNHIDHVHSVAQNGTLVSFSLQNHFPTNPYKDQAVGSQVKLQMPQYFSSPYNLAHMGSTTKTAMHPPQKQQQQQQIWTAPLATQFRQGALLPSHIANWPNRRHNLQTSAHHIPAVHSTTQPSLELVGTKYLHMSQQPLQLVGLGSSLPPLRAKPLHNQLPSICEDNGGQFHSDDTLPIQLMCNERF